MVVGGTAGGFGGLNGRPETGGRLLFLVDFVGSQYHGKLSWINGDRPASFILHCQDDEDGGIADRPDDMADVFTRFLVLLVLLG
jgi:geranylgeranyl transferase type-2 subunit beta